MNTTVNVPRRAVTLSMRGPIPVSAVTVTRSPETNLDPRTTSGERSTTRKRPPAPVTDPAFASAGSDRQMSAAPRILT